MHSTKIYPTAVDAEPAQAALTSAGIPSYVIGIGACMESGMAAVQLVVCDAVVPAALKVLGDE